MSKRNINIYILINFLRLILFSLYFFPQFIFSETCTGGDDCELSVVTNQNHKCVTETKYGSSKKYYAIGSDGQCVYGDYCKKFNTLDSNIMTVYETNECVQSCAKIDDAVKGNYNYIQYGDFCIKKTTANLDKILDQKISSTGYELIPNNGYYILKCNLAEINETIDFNNLPKCINGSSCQTSHYDYEEHKCITSTDHCRDKGKKEIPIDINNNVTKTGCVSECVHDPYIFYNESDNTCLDSCPSGIYYYNGTQKPLKCNETCPDYIIISQTKNNTLCNITCDSGKQYIVNGQKYCDTIIANCQAKNLKAYSNSGSDYCVSKCNDTLDLLGVETFQKKDDANICIDNCYQIEKTYKRNITLTNNDNICTDTCGEGEYIYNLECVKPCPDEAKYHYINDDNKAECVSNCSNGYYLNGTDCVKKCDVADTIYRYVNDSNVCVECSKEEGFYIYDDQKDIKRCYSACPPDYLFHNYDDNACFKIKEGDNEFLNCYERNETAQTTTTPTTPSNFVYQYFKIDDPYTCYPSCNETGEYKNEIKEYHCSKEFDCPNYYYTINSVKKCIEEQYLEVCKKLDYMFLRGKECVPQCNEAEYRVLPDLGDGGIFDRIKSLGKCCLQKEDCGVALFYNNDEGNLLRENCLYKRIKNTDIQNIISSSGGNCVMQCPKEYPYESKDGKICNDTNYYQYYYRVSGNDEDPKYKLVENCKDINRYHINNSYECIELTKCRIGNNYLYYDEDNICYDSCLNLTNKYAFNSSLLRSQQKCMSSCPQGYYHLENEFICLDTCDSARGLFYKYPKEKECVEKCEDNQYIINGNECINECPSYMFINTTIVQFGIKNLTINQCVGACPPEAPYREEDGKKCLTECSSEGKKFKLGYMCIEKCPEGFYIEANECKTSCDKYFTKNYLDEAKTKYNYLCTQVCDNYTLSTNECIEKCPLGENFIGKNKICRSACKNDDINDKNNDGKYYEKRDTNTQEGIEYIIYACVKNMTNMSVGNYLVDGTTHIVDECPTDHPYLSIGERRCYDLCSKSNYYPFTAEYDNETKICATECKENKKYYGEDKICKAQCDSYTNYIINDEDNSCVSKCDISSPYKFKTYKDGRYHCSLQCDSSQPKYTTSDYVCYKDCPAPYNYEYKNECLLKCPGNLFSDFIGNVDNEDKYKCTDKCENATRLYFYRIDLKCIGACNSGDYEIENTHECTSFCDGDNANSVKYHYYTKTEEGITTKKCLLNCPSDKPFLREDNRCEESCNTISYNYYTEDKICRANCPSEYKIIKEKGQSEQAIFPCIKNCNSSYYLDIDKYCISSCTDSYSGNKYFNTIEKICLPSCNNTLYYTQDYECVSSCSEGKFIDNRTCRDFCPDEKRYFVGNYTHGEVNILPNECLYQCPDKYNFIATKTKTIGTEDHTLYICLGSCDHYINKEGNNECVESCNGDNKYYVLDEYGRKSCLGKCPEGAPYFELKDDQITDISCLEKCPENTYKEVNSGQCVELGKCSSKYVDYEENKCVYGCKNTQYTSEIGEGTNKIIVCLNKCITKFGAYLSIGNKCVKKCPDDLVVNYVDNTCICKNLYVVDGTESKCLDTSITQCGKDPNYPSHKYRLASSNQCASSCFGVLSTNSDLCYSSYNNCSHIPNTYIVSEGGNLRCDCQYNYYYIQDKELEGGKRKICLGENDECPIPYTLLNVSNKECVQNCDNYFQLDYKCFSQCPDKTKPNDKKLCVYSNNWYIDENNGNIFLPPDAPCTPQYPYLIDETKQCVNNCSSTKYSYIYKDICYSSCKIASQKNNEIPLSRVPPRNFSKYYQIASYECQCDNKWYRDNKEDIICTSNNECPDGYNYIVKETKECVRSCPKDYPYYFNLECFESCQNAKDNYQYPVKKVESLFECSCENLWERIDNKVVCLTDVNCDSNKLLIYETRQCIEGEGTEKLCPKEAPLKFNNVCYMEKCPDKTKSNVNGNECICNNLWYKQNTGNKYCLDESECLLETHPNLIYSTKECIPGECPSDLWSFSNICYEKCPSGTVEKEKDGKKICVCDQQIGFWYVEEINNRQKITCGQANCETKFQYWNNNTKECLPKSCAEYGLYEYNKICYENQCPNPTVSEDPETNPYKCVTKKYSTSTNINETYNYVKEEIINLYGSIPKDGGLVYNNFNSTMQIYGIKKSIQKTKDTVVRSGLSYIDIGSCSKKVFENNQMGDDEDIVVLKFDLENQRKKSLINPVEYEFVSSKTGKKLDMSVCSKNDVVISYSLFDILNNYRRGKTRNIEEIENDDEFDNILDKIQKQYEKAKKIKSDYDMDSFNIDSALYEDICMTFQVEGKDLVLEDRVGYLYPEYSLCEENCTYSHIDFENERVYCNCPLKSEFDLSREHKFVLNVNNSEEIASRQKGPTNFAVMKCLQRLKESDSLKKNAGFFFTIIIIILQIIFLFINIFYNYKNLKTKINKKTINDNDDEMEKDFKVETIDVKPKNNIHNNRIKNIKNDGNIKTSERPLNSPPPKKRDLNMDKVSGKDMKLKNRVIEEKENEKEKDKDNILNDVNETINELSENIDDDDFSDDSISKDYFTNILDLIKSEHKLLRIKFESAIQSPHSDIVIMILTEIFDKIYLIKTLCLLGKYDMFSIYFSLYLLYHLLLLSFVVCFYNINTIHNIYQIGDYPSLAHDLGYGLLSCLIVWVIYKIFLCLLNNDEIIRRYIRKRMNGTGGSENVRRNNRKFNDLLCKIKTGMIVYFVIQFIFAIVCFLYVTVFCAVYIGTKKKIFKTYGIALLEVLIIKIVYGIILGILRKVGLLKQSAVAYKIAYYLDKFLH